MHMSRRLRAVIVMGALAAGGAIVGIAGAAAAPTTSTATTPASPATTPASPQGAPTPNAQKPPCPNMGQKSGGSYSPGPGPGSSAPAGYSGYGPGVTAS
jgi:hypothetical protein